eukprot:1020826-Amphidinium_carterae.1
MVPEKNRELVMEVMAPVAGLGHLSFCLVIIAGDWNFEPDKMPRYWLHSGLSTVDRLAVPSATTFLLRSRGHANQVDLQKISQGYSGQTEYEQPTVTLKTEVEVGYAHAPARVPCQSAYEVRSTGRQVEFRNH